MSLPGFHQPESGPRLPCAHWLTLTTLQTLKIFIGLLWLSDPPFMMFVSNAGLTSLQVLLASFVFETQPVYLTRSPLFLAQPCPSLPPILSFE